MTEEMEATPATTTEVSVSTKNKLELEVNSLKNEVQILKNKTVEQEKEIKKLKGDQEKIDERLRAQERYSRKDCVLIVNPPFNANTCRDVTMESLKFFNKFLNIYITPDFIKACHIIPNTGGPERMPTVICKFIRFPDKDAVFRERRKLRKARNHINGKPIFLNELLPEIEAKIHAEANNRNLITTTHNCSVSVLVNAGNDKTKFVKVNNVKDLDELPTIKKNNIRQQNNKKDDCGPPAAKKQNNRYA